LTNHAILSWLKQDHCVGLNGLCNQFQTITTFKVKQLQPLLKVQG